jgi:hypothetical protein
VGGKPVSSKSAIFPFKSLSSTTLEGAPFKLCSGGGCEEWGVKFVTVSKPGGMTIISNAPFLPITAVVDTRFLQEAPLMISALSLL